MRQQVGYPYQGTTQTSTPVANRRPDPDARTTNYPTMQRNYQRAPITNQQPQRYVQPYPQPQIQPQPRRRIHWLSWFGIILFIMVLGWFVFSLAGNALQQKFDDVTKPYPRTFQTDANVGHYGRMSHFIVVNLHGEIDLIETQKGHPEVAKIYRITALPPDQDKLDVSISFQDLTGNGHEDALIKYGNTEVPLFNNGTGFQTQPTTK